MRFVPESNNRQDWPRLVAQTVNALVRGLGLSDASIAALQADVTAAEGNITALQTETNWAALVDYADDAAAAIGGVPVGKLYRTGSVIKVRVS